jgi:choline dehydrogenase-like flavoprotein
MTEAQEYGFVMVGGGTAGLVLANHLSANSEWTVAVIEVGGDASVDPRVFIPALFSAAAGTEIDWGFVTTSQVRCHMRLSNSKQILVLSVYSLEHQEGLHGRHIDHVQGKALGSSSAINAQALIPISSTDLDDWQNLVGNEGWNSSLLSYFENIFSLDLPSNQTMQHLNVSWAERSVASAKGPVKASFAGIQQDSFPKAWDEMFQSLSYPLNTSPFSIYSKWSV